jgi:hypothetical protein
VSCTARDSLDTLVRVIQAASLCTEAT